MAIINRITRLFRADLHAVLDRIEEPDALLRQSVREMADAIGNDDQHLRQLEQSQQRLRRQQDHIEVSQQQLTQELGLCLAADQEELARGLIRRRLEAEQLLTILGRNQESIATSIDDLNQRLQQNRSRLAAVEQKLVLLPITDTNAQAATDHGGPNLITDDEVEIAFLAAKQQGVMS